MFQYEYRPSDGALVHNFGSQVWNGTATEEYVDSNLSISNHTVTPGNRLMMKVVGRLYATPLAGEMKFKADEAGAGTDSTVTAERCSNYALTYKSGFVMVLTEEVIEEGIKVTSVDAPDMVQGHEST